jgi:hypothetical protein
VKPTPLAFWVEDDALQLPPSVADVLGGQLTSDERDAVTRIARDEIRQAFHGLQVQLVDGRDGFWRVATIRVVPARGLPLAGSALPLGPLGGMGYVGAREIAFNAVRYAPDTATRSQIVDAMGRGIGRVAVHEFAHQIVGPSEPHNEEDENSYEYPSPARAVQYYGELRWTIWWPALQRKIGV